MAAGLEYKHLLGLPFDMDRQNCWQLIRRFYKDNWDIELTDYACPTDWWDHGLNLMANLAHDEGFEILNCHPRDYRPGDVLVMAINSPVGNHTAVMLDTGQILHHLVGQLSTTTAYGGLFRNSTVGVYRHRDVPKDAPTEFLVDVRSVLPPHVLARLDEIEAARAVQPDGA